MLLLQATARDPSSDHWDGLSRLASRAFASRFELDMAAAKSRGQASGMDARSAEAVRSACPAIQTLTAVRAMCSAHPPKSDSHAAACVDDGGVSFVSIVFMSLNCLTMLLTIFIVTDR